MAMKTAAASERWKKAATAFFRRGFNSSDCKKWAGLAEGRIKVLRNKKEKVIMDTRSQIASLLDSGRDATARIRVEHVIREHNIITAYEFIEVFCIQVKERHSDIATQRECPSDLKEGILSLLFAGPRCSEIPELLSLKNIFQKKYGKEFVSAATGLAGVNPDLIEMLSVNTPSDAMKSKALEEIARDYNVQWDYKETEEELLEPPEVDSSSFVRDSGMPLTLVLDPNDALNRGKGNGMSFEDLAYSAGVAAQKARAAADAFARVAAYCSMQMPASASCSGTSKDGDDEIDECNAEKLKRRHTCNIRYDEYKPATRAT